MAIDQDVLNANVEVHSLMASTYDEHEPHFRPENRTKVRFQLELLAKSGQQRLLDMGCGTGFIIGLAHDLFDRIDGVDITQAMLDRVDVLPGNIVLHNVPVEQLNFADSTFDAVTGYAFLHHLKDYRDALRQAFRVLKKSGRAYFDLDPNRLYWQLVSALETGSALSQSQIVKREIAAVLHTDDRVATEFGIAHEIFNKAEYTKAMLGGIDPDDFCREALSIGFSDCIVTPEWYMGQANVMHQKSFAIAEEVESYLRSIHPASLSLFKYLRFNLVK